MLRFALYLLPWITTAVAAPCFCQDHPAPTSWPELKVELVAEEPLVQDPIGISFGPDGRLWVVEMGDYPAGDDPEHQGRVRLLRDTNGDGAFDRSTVFLKDLEFPNSVYAWGNGVLVCSPPHIIFAVDTDGDDVADETTILFTDLALGNPQHRVNGLRYGLDHRLSLSNGDNGGEIRHLASGRKTQLGTADLRIHLESGEIERLTGPSQFSRARDDWGRWFGGNNSNPIWYCPINAQFPAVPRDFRSTFGLSVLDKDFLVPADFELKKRSPQERRLNQWGDHLRFTAACGLEIYRDSFLGERLRGAFIVAEPAHNLVHLGNLEPSQSTMRLKSSAHSAETEFFSSVDPSCRPVQVRMSPDGSVWIVDMRRAIIEHPDYMQISDLESLDLHKGRGKGRIYRITRKDDTRLATAWSRPSSFSVRELVEHLGHENGWIRDRCQQALIAHADPSVDQQLVERFQNSPSPLARLHAFACLVERASAERPEFQRALQDEHWGIRRFAIQTLSKLKVSSREELALHQLAHDKHPQVRLAFAMHLRLSPHPKSASWSAAMLAEHSNDLHLASVILANSDQRCIEILRCLMEQESLPNDVATWVGDLCFIAVTQPDPRAKQLAWKLLSPESRVLSSQASRIAFGQLSQRIRDAGKSYDRLLEPRSEFDQPARTIVRRNITLARNSLSTPSLTEDARWSLASLGLVDKDAEIDTQLLSQALEPHQPPAVRRQAMSSLVAIRFDATAIELLDHWDSLTPSLRSQATAAFLSRPNWSRQLLLAIQAGSIDIGTISLESRRKLETHRFPDVRNLAKDLFRSSTSSIDAATLARFEVALNQGGDREKGELVFREHCLNCHAVELNTKSLGPNLQAFGPRTPMDWLREILMPAENVEPRYLRYQVETESGEVVEGVRATEDEESLTIRQTDGSEIRIDRDTIIDLKIGGSPMPNGFGSQLTPEQMADLIQYLQHH